MSRAMIVIGRLTPIAPAPPVSDKLAAARAATLTVDPPPIVPPISMALMKRGPDDFSEAMKVCEPASSGVKV